MKRQSRALLGRLIAAILTPPLGAIVLWRRALGVGSDRDEPRSVLLVRLDLMGDVVNGPVGRPRGAAAVAGGAHRLRGAAAVANNRGSMLGRGRNDRP